MSGCYVNTGAQTSKPSPASASCHRQQQPTSTPQQVSSTLTSTSPTSSSPASVTIQHPLPRRKPQRRHQQQQQQQHQRRPRSMLNDRISQIYDTAVEKKPACLHRAAVSPALWLLCQTALVVLFALCCAFLVSHNSAGNGLVKQQSEARKPRIRLEFNNSNYINSTYKVKGENDSYGDLVCVQNESDCASFELQSGNSVQIKTAAVYRINAAVTFRSLPDAIFPNVDTSVWVEMADTLPSKTWISCQQNVPKYTERQNLYSHCALFGIRYLPRNSKVTFRSTKISEIVANPSSTYFEIERR